MSSDAVLKPTLASHEGRFERAWSRLSEGRGEHAPLWVALRGAYEAADRHYHGASHIEFCLRELDALALPPARAAVLEAGIWFHDLILVPGAQDNELASARWFEAEARASLPASVLASVSRLILATTHRTPVVDPDEQLMCDIDLSSLAAPWARFVEDCDGLRAESSAPEEAYTRGKLAFYSQLLARRSIYYTEQFQRQHEPAARANIERYCEMLRAQVASTGAGVAKG